MNNNPNKPLTFSVNFNTKRPQILVYFSKMTKKSYAFRYFVQIAVNSTKGELFILESPAVIENGKIPRIPFDSSPFVLV